MTDEAPDSKKRKKKFRHTRELVRVALHDGMTQSEIARVCRTQQSQVSAWANGKRKATVGQIAPLVKKYGYRLNRTSARIYRVRREPDLPWEETEEGRSALKALEVFEAVPDEPQEAKDEARKQFFEELGNLGEGLRRLHFNPAGSAEQLRQAYGWSPASMQVVRVEGRVIFQHVFEKPRETLTPGRRESLPRIRWTPSRRWTVHDQGPGRLMLVRSEVMVLDGAQLAWWSRECGDHLDTDWGSSNPAKKNPEVHSRDEAGRWLSEIEEPRGAAALIERADRLVRQAGVHDQRTVPFLLRKALLVAGHEVPGVVTITAESD